VRTSPCLPEVLELVLADDGEHLRDGQAHHLDLRQLVGRAAGDLRHAQSRQLRLQLLELLLCHGGGTRGREGTSEESLAIK
jgi:hypothetical protein